MVQNPKDDLQHIRQMMERSSRFISLSGLSGVVAGIVALAGAAAGYYILEEHTISCCGPYETLPPQVVQQLTILAISILAAALGFGMIFTVRKTQRAGLKIWTPATKSLLLNLFVPLAAGGAFCLALLQQNHFALLAPTTLVFYGLALVNASKYTYSDIRYLGYCEVLLGLVALFLPCSQLLLWTLGFGLLHIIYGIVMFKKYR